MRVLRGLTVAAAFAAVVGASCGEGASPTATPAPLASATATVAGTPSDAPPTAVASAAPSRRASDGTPLGIALAFDEARAMADVRELARPVYTGRHTGTPGELLGAQYLADAFAAAGLRPGGDGAGALQTFPVDVQELGAPPVLELTHTSTGETRALRLRDDFRPIVIGPAGAGDMTGDVVFGGTGAELDSLDLEGKLVLLVPRGSLLDILGRARRAGAVGVLVTSGETELLKGEARPPNADAMPLVQLSRAGAAALLEGSGHTREELNDLIARGQPLSTFPLPWRAHLAIDLAPPATADAHNVIAFLPASSPTDRSIVIGAHYEEIGPDPDGVVFPAANDNASGTAVMLELARRLAEDGFAPDLNVVFIGWSGHEEGLFGSEHYLAAPRFPVDQIALYVNIDTVGQGGGPSLSVNGSARDAFEAARTLLAGVAEAFAVEFGSARGGGSDDVNFAAQGVPTLALAWSGVFSGTPMIHTPADDAAGVDPAKLRVTGVVATLVTVLAATDR